MIYKPVYRCLSSWITWNYKKEFIVQEVLNHNWSSISDLRLSPNGIYWICEVEPKYETPTISLCESKKLE